MTTAPATQRATSGASPRDFLLGSVYLGAHAVLGVLVWAVPAFGIIHALAVGIVGLGFAVVRPRIATAMVVGYLGAAEVLWRMGRGVLFHEYGKYAVSAIVLVSLLRFPPRRNRALAICYLLCLLPSAYLTLSDLPTFEDARQQISFNLSGPLAMTLCVLFFSQLKVNMVEARRLFFVVLGPVMAVGMFSLVSTLSHSNIEFRNGSNFAASGGFGPNQVSAILGLGILLALLPMFLRRLPWRTQLPTIAMAGFFAIQATLTFSRGGIVMGVASLFMALVFLIRDRRSRITLVVVALLFSTVGYYVVYPQLEKFTKGKVTERYTNTDSSNRVTLAGYDITIFEDNFLIGVGPGMATDLRDVLGKRGIAHTEYTRMLAEHGLLGATSLVLFGVLALRTLRQPRDYKSRAMVAAFLAWAMMFLLIDAMRLAAPAVIFGFACMIAYSGRALPARAGPKKPAPVPAPPIAHAAASAIT